MTTTWILIAHRGGARVYAQRGRRRDLELIEEFEHPEGRLKNREIDSDRPGRSFDSRGVGRHAYDKEQEPTEHVAERFARQLATLLDQGRMREHYARLVLVAEPRFLGNLRAALNPATAALVTATIDKDLGGVDARDLPRYLSGEIGP